MQIDISKIKFDSRGLVPAVVVDVSTNDVVMLAYMNAIACINKKFVGSASAPTFCDTLVLEPQPSGAVEQGRNKR